MQKCKLVAFGKSSPGNFESYNSPQRMWMTVGGTEKLKGIVWYDAKGYFHVIPFNPPKCVDANDEVEVNINFRMDVFHRPYPT